ncbi:MAG: MFS transporter [Bacilli bacterium]|nr:MFS transporter [Bacilli bacterium]
MALLNKNAAEGETSPKKALKLNFKRTFVIGFAFFGILMLWQVYNTYCSPMLTNLLMESMGKTSEEVSYIVGVIMAMDNVAALILLPIFGNLSDKTHTKIGKRMPYILIGTAVSALVFPLIPLFYHLNNLAGVIVCMGLVLVFMMMYRNPAVALMPDLTPKPLRSKANGIINLVGYVGAMVAGGLAMFLKITSYGMPGAGNLWIIETPFLIASVLMVVTCIVLFVKVKENEVAIEMEEDMRRGEEEAAVEEKVDDEAPMPKKNLIMLILILLAEFFWFFGFNAIETFGQNYGIYYLLSESGSMSTCTIVLTVASLVTFVPAGILADKIGRKWTIVIGLGLLIAMMVVCAFVKPSDVTYVKDINGVPTTFHQFPVILYVIFGVSGIGWALINCCSFPMVVELCSSKKIGKFTGLYYAASMAAQSLTPIVIGFLFQAVGYQVMPIYSGIFFLGAAIMFLFVKNVKANKVSNKKGLEALDQD